MQPTSPKAYSCPLLYQAEGTTFAQAQRFGTIADLTRPTVRDRSAYGRSPTQARREQRKRPSTASAVYFIKPKTGTREGSGPQPFAAVRRRNQSLQSFSARPTDLVELTQPMRCNTGAITARDGWPIGASRSSAHTFCLIGPVQIDRIRSSPPRCS